ncbi:MAG: DegT/DnrJ/EryC1/StrS family aminotransferase [Terriglobales bacterium]
MIPRHRPPFSLRQFLRAQIGQAPGSSEQWEAEIVERLEIPHAILLPSARFGICAGLRICVPAGESVVVPVFNCSAVHEAAIRSGRDTKFVDCSDRSFLMDLGRIPKASAWVLSEPYGQTYDLSAAPSLRPFCILDMAMSIPEKCLLERLAPCDLGVFSFGLGKALYAGWGGLAITRDRRLAQELRRTIQVSCRNDPGRGEVLGRTLVLGARLVAHWKPIYGSARKIVTPRPQSTKSDGIQSPPDGWSRAGTESEEWRRLPIRPELKMVAFNFQNWARNAASRRALETQYRNLLQGLAGVTLPAPSPGVLSHFTIRVPASDRDRIRERLWKRGFDTGDLFGFPGYCDPAMFPNSFRASRELINLPMDRGVTVASIQSIARTLRMDSE